MGQFGTPVSELELGSWILIPYGADERWVEVTGITRPGGTLPGGRGRSGSDRWIVSVALDGRAWQLRLSGDQEYPTVWSEPLERLRRR